MEGLSYSPLLHITQEDVEFARASYAIDSMERISDSIDAVQEWMRKQPHLAESSKHTSRDYLERLFMLARGSTEATKEKIDRLFTMRCMLPELCLNRTPGEFDKLLSCICLAPLPKLNPKEKTRIIVTQIKSKNLDNLTMMDYCRYGTLIGEYRMYYDYNSGDRFILDMNHVSLLSKLNPVVMKKFDLLGEIYGSRIKGIHVLNAPQYVDTMVNLLKSSMRQKVASRIHVHSSYEELYEFIDKSVLPEDFGGEEMSMEKVAAKWRDHFNSPEALQLIADQDKLVSDESKRSNVKLNQDVMGMPGSFRKLNVD